MARTSMNTTSIYGLLLVGLVGCSSNDEANTTADTGSQALRKDAAPTVEQPAPEARRVAGAPQSYQRRDRFSVRSQAARALLAMSETAANAVRKVVAGRFDWETVTKCRESLKRRQRANELGRGLGRMLENPAPNFGDLLAAGEVHVPVEMIKSGRIKVPHAIAQAHKVQQ